MASSLYTINGLSHQYTDVPVLEIKHLSIDPSAIVGLVGPNGSGKTTLLKLMAFIDTPSKGEILFDGLPGRPFSENVRFQVALLTQEPYLMKRTVYKNIIYGLKVRGDQGNFDARVKDALSMVGLDMDRFANRQWYELSGGEAQRVALAARLILKPRVLLMDEPTASVDVASSRLIREASLMARREWGTTLVIASHDKEWLYTVCDDVIHLFKGRPAGSGKDNIIFGPWQPRKDGLFEKKIQNGNAVRVGPPPDKDAAAFMDPSLFTISLDQNKSPDPNLAHISGVLSRLVLEKKTCKIMADIHMGGMFFHARITPETMSSLGLVPGIKVVLSYNPLDVKWR